MRCPWPSQRTGSVESAQDGIAGGGCGARAAAVVRRHAEVLEVTAEWEARRAELERRMDDLTAFAASSAVVRSMRAASIRYRL